MKSKIYKYRIFKNKIKLKKKLLLFKNKISVSKQI